MILTFEEVLASTERGGERQWYISLPQYIEQGGTLEELQMIAGADTLLDNLADGENVVKLDVSLWANKEDINQPYHAKLLYKGLFDENPDNGANYTAFAPDGKLGTIHYPVWLCKVIKWLFGEYPKVITVNKTV